MKKKITILSFVSNKIYIEQQENTNIEIYRTDNSYLQLKVFDLHKDNI
jgi:hypothetical protein